MRLLVVLDDMALPLGKIRLRRKGSSGGHRGLASVIQELGTEEFPRLRVGIGPPEVEDSVGHVLGKFSSAEWEIIEDALSMATSAAALWLSAGIDECMNRYNT